MNSKENAKEIIRFGRPEKIVTGLPADWVGYFGVNHEGFAGGGHDSPVGTVWTDVWGTTWHKELDGVMGFPQVHPLADFPAALRTYRWPNPDDERIIGRVYTQAAAVAAHREERFLVGSHRETLWEKSYMLAGMETLFVSFHESPRAVHELLDRIIAFDLAVAEHYLKVGVDFVSMGDDLGTQSGLLLSPAILDEFFLPRYRRLFEVYKRHGVGVTFHSCGHISPLLERFISLGVDVLNPVQASANDLAELRRVTQGRMALEGGVRSAVIVSGPPAAIRSEVATRILQLGRQGGYFCTADQGMPWPPEHYQALAAAVEELGHYPLDIDKLEAVARGEA